MRAFVGCLHALPWRTALPDAAAVLSDASTRRGPTFAPGIDLLAVASAPGEVGLRQRLGDALADVARAELGLGAALDFILELLDAVTDD
jgi:hypothetical protein